MDDKLDNIIFLLKNIESKIDSIDNRLYAIEINMKNVNNDCSKMSEHIEFVEKTYTLARAPLNFIKNKIEYMMNGDATSELPQLEYKQ